MELTVIAALLSTALLLSNLASILLASSRLKRPRTIAPPAGKAPPVSIVVPSRGVEPFTEETLERAFSLDWPRYELDLLRRPCRRSGGQADHEPPSPAFRQCRPGCSIGDDRISGNPKLNNCVKGWEAARHTGSSLPIPTC